MYSHEPSFTRRQGQSCRRWRACSPNQTTQVVTRTAVDGCRRISGICQSIGTTQDEAADEFTRTVIDGCCGVVVAGNINGTSGTSVEPQPIERTKRTERRGISACRVFYGTLKDKDECRIFIDKHTFSSCECPINPPDCLKGFVLTQSIPGTDVLTEDKKRASGPFYADSMSNPIRSLRHNQTTPSTHLLHVLSSFLFQRGPSE